MDTNTAIIRYQNWIDIFREWADSGMTKRDFCREKNIHEKTFFYYQRKVRRMAAESAGLPAAASESRPEIVMYFATPKRIKLQDITARLLVSAYQQTEIHSP